MDDVLAAMRAQVAVSLVPTATCPRAVVPPNVKRQPDSEFSRRLGIYELTVDDSGDVAYAADGEVSCGGDLDALFASHAATTAAGAASIAASIRAALLATGNDQIDGPARAYAPASGTVDLLGAEQLIVALDAAAVLEATSGTAARSDSIFQRIAHDSLWLQVLVAVAFCDARSSSGESGAPQFAVATRVHAASLLRGALPLCDPTSLASSPAWPRVVMDNDVVSGPAGDARSRTGAAALIDVLICALAAALDPSSSLCREGDDEDAVASASGGSMKCAAPSTAMRGARVYTGNHSRDIIASEGVALVRLLLRSTPHSSESGSHGIKAAHFTGHPAWAPLVSSRLEECLRAGLAAATTPPPRNTPVAPNPVAAKRALAALAIVGGFVEPVRAGGLVSILPAALPNKDAPAARELLERSGAGSAVQRSQQPQQTPDHAMRLQQSGSQTSWATPGWVAALAASPASVMQAAAQSSVGSRRAAEAAATAGLDPVAVRMKHTTASIDMALAQVPPALTVDEYAQWTEAAATAAASIAATTSPNAVVHDAERTTSLKVCLSNSCPVNPTVSSLQLQLMIERCTTAVATATGIRDKYLASLPPTSHSSAWFTVPADAVRGVPRVSLPANCVPRHLWPLIRKAAVIWGLSDAARLPAFAADVLHYSGSDGVAKTSASRPAFVAALSTPGIKPSSDGRIARSDLATGRAIVDVPMEAGSHWTWSFRLLRDDSGSETTCFGFAAQPFPDSYNSGMAWAYRCYNGHTYARGVEDRRSGQQRVRVHPGDVLSFEFDGAAGTVTLEVNGNDLGVVFSDLWGAEAYYPAAYFYGGTREVELISCTRLDTPDDSGATVARGSAVDGSSGIEGTSGRVHESLHDALASVAVTALSEDLSGALASASLRALHLLLLSRTAAADALAEVDEGLSSAGDGRTAVPEAMGVPLRRQLLRAALQRTAFAGLRDVEHLEEAAGLLRDRLRALIVAQQTGALASLVATGADRMKMAANNATSAPVASAASGVLNTTVATSEPIDIVDAFTRFGSEEAARGVVADVDDGDEVTGLDVEPALALDSPHPLDHATATRPAPSPTSGQVRLPEGFGASRGVAMFLAASMPREAGTALRRDPAASPPRIPEPVPALLRRQSRRPPFESRESAPSAEVPYVRSLPPPSPSLPPPAAHFLPSPSSLPTLESMGFPSSWCRAAIRAVGDDAEAAVLWILARSDDLAAADAEAAADDTRGAARDTAEAGTRAVTAPEDGAAEARRADADMDEDEGTDGDLSDDAEDAAYEAHDGDIPRSLQESMPRYRGDGGATEAAAAASNGTSASNAERDDDNLKQRFDDAAELFSSMVAMHAARRAARRSDTDSFADREAERDVSVALGIDDVVRGAIAVPRVDHPASGAGDDDHDDDNDDDDDDDDDGHAEDEGGGDGGGEYGDADEDDEEADYDEDTGHADGADEMVEDGRTGDGGVHTSGAGTGRALRRGGDGMRGDAVARAMAAAVMLGDAASPEDILRLAAFGVHSPDDGHGAADSSPAAATAAAPAGYRSSVRAGTGPSRRGAPQPPPVTGVALPARFSIVDYLDATLPPPTAAPVAPRPQLASPQLQPRPRVGSTATDVAVSTPAPQPSGEVTETVPLPVPSFDVPLWLVEDALEEEAPGSGPETFDPARRYFADTRPGGGARALASAVPARLGAGRLQELAPHRNTGADHRGTDFGAAAIDVAGAEEIQARSRVLSMVSQIPFRESARSHGDSDRSTGATVSRAAVWSALRQAPHSAGSESSSSQNLQADVSRDMEDPTSIVLGCGLRALSRRLRVVCSALCALRARACLATLMLQWPQAASAISTLQDTEDSVHSRASSPGPDDQRFDETDTARPELIVATPLPAERPVARRAFSIAAFFGPLSEADIAYPNGASTEAGSHGLSVDSVSARPRQLPRPTDLILRTRRVCAYTLTVELLELLVSRPYVPHWWTSFVQYEKAGVPQMRQETAQSPQHDGARLHADGDLPPPVSLTRVVSAISAVGYGSSLQNDRLRSAAGLLEDPDVLMASVIAAVTDNDAGTGTTAAPGDSADGRTLGSLLAPLVVTALCSAEPPALAATGPILSARAMDAPMATLTDGAALRNALARRAATHVAGAAHRRFNDASLVHSITTQTATSGNGGRSMTAGPLTTATASDVSIIGGDPNLAVATWATSLLLDSAAVQQGVAHHVMLHTRRQTQQYEHAEPRAVADVDVTQSPGITSVGLGASHVLRHGDTQTALFAAADATLRVVLNVWVLALRSPSLLVKYTSIRNLIDILERARALGTAGAPITWPTYLAALPITRLLQLTERRLDREREDAPRSSRYLQGLVELSAIARLLGDVAGETVAGAAPAAMLLDAGKGSAIPVGAAPAAPGVVVAEAASADAASGRFYLRFRDSSAAPLHAGPLAPLALPLMPAVAGGSSNCFVTIGSDTASVRGGDALMPPWTAEFWIRIAAPASSTIAPSTGRIAGTSATSSSPTLTAVRPRLAASSTTTSPHLHGATPSNRGLARPVSVDGGVTTAAEVTMRGTPGNPHAVSNVGTSLSSGMPLLLALPPAHAGERAAAAAQSALPSPPAHPTFLMTGSRSCILVECGPHAAVTAEDASGPSKAASVAPGSCADMSVIASAAASHSHRVAILLGAHTAASAPATGDSALSSGAANPLIRPFDCALPTGVWTHVSFVATPRDGVALFINATLAGVVPVPAPGFPLPAATIGGARDGTGAAAAPSFSGDLHEVRLWRVARSPAELARDAGVRLTRLPPSLMLYLPLDLEGGTGRFVADAAGQFSRCFASGGLVWRKSPRPPTTPLRHIDVLSTSGVMSVPDNEVDASDASAADVERTTIRSTWPARLSLSAAGVVTRHALAAGTVSAANSASTCSANSGDAARDPDVSAAPVSLVSSLDAWFAEQRQAMHVTWRELPPVSELDSLGGALSARPVDSTSGAVSCVADAACRNPYTTQSALRALRLAVAAELTATMAAFASAARDAAATAAEKASSPTPTLSSQATMHTEKPWDAESSWFISGSFDWPEALVRATVVGVIEPPAAGYVARAATTSSTMSRRVTLYITSVVEGPADVLEWLVGARFIGKYNGEAFSGAWMTHVRSERPPPLRFGSVRVHPALASPCLRVSPDGALVTHSGRGGTWGVAVAGVALPRHLWPSAAQPGEPGGPTVDDAAASGSSLTLDDVADLEYRPSLIGASTLASGQPPSASSRSVAGCSRGQASPTMPSASPAGSHSVSASSLYSTAAQATGSSAVKALSQGWAEVMGDLPGVRLLCAPTSVPRVAAPHAVVDGAPADVDGSRAHAGGEAGETTDADASHAAADATGGADPAGDPTTTMSGVNGASAVPPMTCLAAAPCARDAVPHRDGRPTASRTDEMQPLAPMIAITSGPVAFDVLVERCSSQYIGIGVATRGASLTSFLGADDGRGWSYQATRELWTRGHARPYGEAFANGDVITVQVEVAQDGVNAEAARVSSGGGSGRTPSPPATPAATDGTSQTSTVVATIEYLRDGESLGVAFTRASSRSAAEPTTAAVSLPWMPPLVNGFVPAVAIYSEGDSVRMLGLRSGFHMRGFPLPANSKGASSPSGGGSSSGTRASPAAVTSLVDVVAALATSTSAAVGATSSTSSNSTVSSASSPTVAAAWRGGWYKHIGWWRNGQMHGPGVLLFRGGRTPPGASAPCPLQPPPAVVAAEEVADIAAARATLQRRAQYPYKQWNRSASAAGAASDETTDICGFMVGSWWRGVMTGVYAWYSVPAGTTAAALLRPSPRSDSGGLPTAVQAYLAAPVSTAAAVGNAPLLYSLLRHHRERIDASAAGSAVAGPLFRYDRDVLQRRLSLDEAMEWVDDKRARKAACAVNARPSCAPCHSGTSALRVMLEAAHLQRRRC